MKKSFIMGLFVIVLTCGGCKKSEVVEVEFTNFTQEALNSEQATDVETNMTTETAENIDFVDIENIPEEILVSEVQGDIDRGIEIAQEYQKNHTRDEIIASAKEQIDKRKEEKASLEKISTQYSNIAERDAGMETRNTAKDANGKLVYVEETYPNNNPNNYVYDENENVIYCSYTNGNEFYHQYYWENDNILVDLWKAVHYDENGNEVALSELGMTEDLNVIVYYYENGVEVGELDFPTEEEYTYKKIINDARGNKLAEYEWAENDDKLKLVIKNKYDANNNMIESQYDDPDGLDITTIEYDEHNNPVKAHSSLYDTETVYKNDYYDDGKLKEMICYPLGDDQDYYYQYSYTYE